MSKLNVKASALEFPLWKLCWKTVGLLILTVAIMSLVIIFDYSSQHTYTYPEEALGTYILLIGAFGCAILLAVGIIIVIGFRCQNVMLLYLLALTSGFLTICGGNVAGNTTSLNSAITILGIFIVIMTSVAILSRRNVDRETNVWKALSVFAIIIFLFVTLVGFTFPQWFDAAAQSFPDIRLRNVIRDTVGKGFGFITQSDLESITYLNAWREGVCDLTGLEKCTNLEDLLINGRFTDISVLSGLTSMKKLEISSATLQDISPLADLSGLTHLYCRYSRITDISALADLKKLSVIYLDENEIEDISVLSDLSGITILEISSNDIADLSPLVENDGIGEGDVINIWGNPLSAESIEIYIPQLESRGVDVLESGLPIKSP